MKNIEIEINKVNIENGIYLVEKNKNKKLKIVEVKKFPSGYGYFNLKIKPLNKKYKLFDNNKEKNLTKSRKDIISFFEKKYNYKFRILLDWFNN